MRGVGLRQALNNGGFECREVGVIGGVEALLFNELPQSLNQVQVGRIGRKKTQLDLQACRERHHLGTALVAGIVQDDGERDPEIEGGQVPQERTDLRRRNVGVVRDGKEFMGDRVERAQDIETLPPRGGPQEDARHGPEEPQERS